MPGRGHAPEGGRANGKFPNMTENEKNAHRQKRYDDRQRNKKAHWEVRKLETVARGIAREVPAYANATKVLAEIEDINKHLQGYFNAGVAILGERFPELVEQSIETALDQYDEEGNLIRQGDATERRFLIQKALDLKPLVDSGSFKNQQMMDKMRSLLEEEGTKVVATERKIEVVKD